MLILRLLITSSLLLWSPFGLARSTATPASDADIAARLIEESIASYPGNCPCPYNSTANGRACGKRSAYSRPGGRAPLCYAEDVSPSMIQRYRQQH